MKKKYTYYIVYNVLTDEGKRGTGRARLEIKKPLDTFERIVAVEEKIKNNQLLGGLKNPSVTVLTIIPIKK